MIAESVIKNFKIQIFTMEEDNDNDVSPPKQSKIDSFPCELHINI